MLAKSSVNFVSLAGVQLSTLDTLVAFQQSRWAPATTFHSYSRGTIHVQNLSLVGTIFYTKFYVLISHVCWNVSRKSKYVHALYKIFCSSWLNIVFVFNIYLLLAPTVYIYMTLLLWTVWPAYWVGHQSTDIWYIF